jgi:hypothetical protein
MPTFADRGCRGQRDVCMFEHNSGTPGAISTKWMIHIVEEIKLLLLLGNRLKHIRGNVSYLVTWNAKEFTVGYFLRLDK